ncbi:MAG TPA: ABC transporter permease [Candidatus Limnocylindrales bacterium]
MRWEWIPNNLGALARATVEHLVLTGVAVGVGFVISFCLALVVYRRRSLYGPLAAIAGILYTIPSLALFAFLVPFTGLTAVTAEIGLVSYTLLILLRNTVAGFDSVAPEIREAADGMGYGSLRRLFAVELPLAAPLMIAGLRIATVTTIGLVMVTALIGEGGLGQVMLRGFNFRNWVAVYAAGVLTVALAVIFDIVLVLLQRLATPWARARAG